MDSEDMRENQVIGKSHLRVDGWEKVLGRGIYTKDLGIYDPLYCSLKQSEHAHAEIIEIDTTEARAIKGVVGIFTADDITGINNVGVINLDQPVMADDRVRHYGDVVAIAVAETKELADQAANMIKVNYKPLPGVFDPVEALKKDSPLVHPDGKYGNKGNLMSLMEYQRGDFQKAFEEADVIIENVYRPGYQEHAFIETEGCIALSHGEKITIYGSLQCPFYVRDAVANALGLKRSNVRVIQVGVGGAFGGKEDVPSEVATRAALASYLTGRPVINIRTREESISIHTKRHPMVIRHKIGAKKDGTLVAADVDIISDQGAYCSVGKYVQKRAVVHACGPYVIPNSRVISRFVYTNNILTGAFRGFGTPQVAMAVEEQMDELANALDMDPLTLRTKNMLRKNDLTPKGQLLDNCGDGLENCILSASKKSEWKLKRHDFNRFNEKMNKKDQSEIKPGENIRKGIGMSTIMYGVALGDSAPDMATATCQIAEDGSVIITTGGVEMGQGAKTVLSQIAAQEVGVPLHYVNILDADTSIVQNSGPSVASRVTPVIGEATRRAAYKAVRQVRKLAMEKFGYDYDYGEEEFEDGENEEMDVKKHIYPAVIDGEPHIVDRASGKKLRFKDLVQECYFNTLKLIGLGYSRPPTLLEDGSYRDYYTYSFACHIAEVEVDMDTGVVDVKKITAANDVGRALNPMSVEGQIEGGAVQGMGYAIMEGLVQDNGKILNPSFTDYLIPTALDAPELIPLIIEERDDFGPYGAKGIGEPSLIPTPGAVLNAVGHAIGKPIRMTPASPENVWKVINDRI